MVYRFFTLVLLIFTSQALLANDYYYDDDGYYEYEGSEPCEPFYIPCYAPECATPCDPCCWNIFLNADYLFWQVRSDELLYTYNETQIPGQAFAKTTSRVEPDYSSGIRLGLGSIVPCFNSWHLSAEWTYFHSNSRDSTEGTDLVPIFASPDAGPFADTTLAEAKYSINLNIADLTLEKAFCPIQKLVLSPSIGVRGIWLDQDFNVRYLGGTLTDILATNSIYLKGGGLRAGLSTQWDAFCGISLLAWSNIDLLWSHFDISQKGLQGDSGVVRSSIDDSVHTLVPMLELFLGASWARDICCTKVRARVGWETQYFLNGIQFNQYTSDTGILIAHQLGGLSLSGLTAGLSVGF